MGVKMVGARVKRIEDPRLLRGEGAFVDDIRLPGVVHMAVLRSPHAHARVHSVEVAAALTWTDRAAYRELGLAKVVVQALPDVFAALWDGRIDRGKGPLVGQRWRRPAHCDPRGRVHAGGGP